MYHAAAVGIVYDRAAHTQKFYAYVVFHCPPPSALLHGREEGGCGVVVLSLMCVTVCDRV